MYGVCETRLNRFVFTINACMHVFMHACMRKTDCASSCSLYVMSVCMHLYGNVHENLGCTITTYLRIYACTHVCMYEWKDLHVIFYMLC